MDLVKDLNSAGRAWRIQSGPEEFLSKVLLKGILKSDNWKVNLKEGWIEKRIQSKWELKKSYYWIAGRDGQIENAW